MFTRDGNGCKSRSRDSRLVRFGFSTIVELRLFGMGADVPRIELVGVSGPKRATRLLEDIHERGKRVWPFGAVGEYLIKTGPHRTENVLEGLLRLSRALSRLPGQLIAKQCALNDLFCDLRAEYVDPFPDILLRTLIKCLDMLLDKPIEGVSMQSPDESSSWHVSRSFPLSTGLVVAATSSILESVSRV